MVILLHVAASGVGAALLGWQCCARARHYRPVHFTAVSSVTATFDFRVSAGISGSIGRAVDPDQRPLTLDYSTTVAENPTITIIPITGEEFTSGFSGPLKSHNLNSWPIRDLTSIWSSG